MGAISPSIFIFYCFAFLKTQASCFWFNFSEEESTMRFSCCFAQKYCPYLLSFFFLISLLFPWCWMHVYKKKRHLWSMDSSGDMFNSVSFCQNLQLCFLKEVQLETLISVHSALYAYRARFSLRNFVYACMYRPEITVIKRKQSICEKV